MSLHSVMPPIKKQRLDVLIVEKGLAPTRQRARALIMAGKVFVEDFPVDKPGTMIDIGKPIDVRGKDHDFVSRGGLKLEKALQRFHVSVEGLTCMDVGASTGGFTDCLLQYRAKKVFAVDVGYGQLAWPLRQNRQVVVIERTNIRNMAADIIPDPIDFITIDVSFISLKIVVPAVMKFLVPKGKLIVLVKPQFEVGKGNVGKGGIVKDPALHEMVLDDLTAFFANLRLESAGLTSSPILGTKGNKEFLMYLQHTDI